LLPFVANLTEVRKALFTTDAWRSFWIIAVGMMILLWYKYKPIKPVWVVAAIGILCLVDLWSVDKRYLYDGQFLPARVRTETFAQSAADKQILQDTAPDYRVLNLASNTFNENKTSYWHKSIGGYHAAKLLRYQQLIEYYISPEMQSLSRAIQTAQGDLAAVDGSTFDVLNMLNMKYVIVPTQSGETALRNPHAYGNAWFVDTVRYVADANEEIATLGTISPDRTAVVDIRFKAALGGAEQCAQDTTASIRLLSYEPNRLVYEANASRNGVAVFSEIYYPDWKARIDGELVSIGRADYVLRALAIPAGKHTIEMTFYPTSVDVTEVIAYIGWLVLLCGVGALLFRVGKGKRL
jgi:hypothetical protein